MFDGVIALVGTLKFAVTKESIGLAMKLPYTGEKWGKNHKVPRVLFQHLFLLEYKDVDSSKGFSEHWLQEQYRAPMRIVNRVIGCTSRYTMFFPFHFKILLHLLSN